MMIRITDLVKEFDGVKALDKACLNVQSGTVYGLVGPNGAGKSTIIRHITGIYKQDKGEVLVKGEKVFENPKIKSKIAYIPDELYSFPQANVMDMMKFYRGIYPNFNMERFEKLKTVFATIDPKKPIRKLSKGMQKQVSFWITTCCNSELIVLDEPVDGLDPVMRRQIWGLLMSDVEEHNTTVFVSSHNLRELEDVCDHVGIMHNGKVILERSLSELQENISKLQVVFQNGLPDLPADLDILHMSNTGRIYNLIVKGNPAIAQKKLAAASPLLIDTLPLTLEEIFIYELGGENYAVKDILL